MMNSHELKIKAPMLLLTSGPTKHPKNKNQNPSKTTWKHTDTLQTIQPHLEKILARIEPRFINFTKFQEEFWGGIIFWNDQTEMATTTSR